MRKHLKTRKIDNIQNMKSNPLLQGMSSVAMRHVVLASLVVGRC